MSFIQDVSPNSVEGMAISQCPVCPGCENYNACWCSIFGVEIVDYALSDWGKSGYAVSAAISNSADISGVDTPWRR